MAKPKKQQYYIVSLYDEAFHSMVHQLSTNNYVLGAQVNGCVVVNCVESDFEVPEYRDVRKLVQTLKIDMLHSQLTEKKKEVLALETKLKEI